MQPARRQSVVDIALHGSVPISDEVAARSKALGRLRLSDVIFHHLTRLAAISVLLYGFIWEAD